MVLSRISRFQFSRRMRLLSLSARLKYKPAIPPRRPRRATHNPVGGREGLLHSDLGCYMGTCRFPERYAFTLPAPESAKRSVHSISHSRPSLRIASSCGMPLPPRRASQSRASAADCFSSPVSGSSSMAAWRRTAATGSTMVSSSPTRAETQVGQLRPHSPRGGLKSNVGLTSTYTRPGMREGFNYSAGSSSCWNNSAKSIAPTKGVASTWWAGRRMPA